MYQQFSHNVKYDQFQLTFMTIWHVKVGVFAIWFFYPKVTQIKLKKHMWFGLIQFSFKIKFEPNQANILQSGLVRFLWFLLKYYFIKIYIPISYFKWNYIKKNVDNNRRNLLICYTFYNKIYKISYILNHQTYLKKVIWKRK